MENVYCIQRSDLEKVFGSPLPTGSLSDPPLAKVLALPHHFLPRTEAESNPAYKQIIPYQLFLRHNRLFVFQRGQGVGESRLAGKLSIGIGGHINQEDSKTGGFTTAEYTAALLRERDEELICPRIISSKFLGWINAEKTAVDKVHLGAVHLCRIPVAENIRLRGDEDLHAIGWLLPGDILFARRDYEKWSELAVKLAQ
ncbi:MAG: hypothetical protein A2511_10830 [Deltaproteobacteria bacterium RIFOXYD12_FULL_50_9]|nr:MAG: hypothetical protein A2511_10830 [Deltaproteobacteria bacterium RIFOXYD12_FULL_50_9]